MRLGPTIPLNCHDSFGAFSEPNHFYTVHVTERDGDVQSAFGGRFDDYGARYYYPGAFPFGAVQGVYQEHRGPGSSGVNARTQITTVQ